MEATPWKCALEAVCKDFKRRDCTHRSDATLWKGFCKSVSDDMKRPQLASLRGRSLEVFP
eukprot:2663481-Amphidinium_carterae.3